jgi:hypothetical protein
MDGVYTFRVVRLIESRTDGANSSNHVGIKADLQESRYPTLYNPYPGPRFLSYRPVLVLSRPDRIDSRGHVDAIRP